MPKKVLILTSSYTGSGHKSISDSLSQAFELYYPHVHALSVEAFELGGFFSSLIGKTYNPLTRYLPFVWKLFYQISDHLPSIIKLSRMFFSRKKFMSLVSAFQPDMILSVHPGYVRLVLDSLEVSKINIPFITILADITTLSSYWIDARATFTVCPTEESKHKVLSCGITEDRIKVLGFPVKSEFQQVDLEAIEAKINSPKKRILLVDGYSRNTFLEKIIHSILRNTPFNLTVICGKNRNLFKKLTSLTKAQYQDRLSVFGYVNNLHHFMDDCHLLITKAGPNIIFEALNKCIPMLLINHIPGQEEGNLNFVTTHNIGRVCLEPDKIIQAINEILLNNEIFKSILESQFQFRAPLAARHIVDFVISGQSGKT